MRSMSSRFTGSDRIGIEDLLIFFSSSYYILSSPLPLNRSEEKV